MTKIVKYFIFIITILGCSVPQSVPTMRKKTDPYNGHITVSISGIPTYWCHEKENDYRSLFLGIMAWKETPKSKPLYSISADYSRNQKWIFIDGGPSFQAIYNGKPHIFISGSGSYDARDIGFDGAVSELAIWDVSREDLEEMALSPSIQFRITGKDGRIERCLNAADRGYILKFLLETQDF